MNSGAGNERADAFVEANRTMLSVLIDCIVPADDFPSATAAGGLDFLGSVLRERQDWIERVAAVFAGLESTSAAHYGRPFTVLAAREREVVLDALVGNADYGWFAALVNGGYYGDPQNGGNRGARSWEMIDWRPDPPHGWPDAAPVQPAVFATPESLLERYDAIIVGSGAGGGVAACGLAEAGRRVLVIEAGGWPATNALRQDYLRNPRSVWGLDPTTGPRDLGNPRVFDAVDHDVLLRPSDPLWGNNAMTAGGGTRVYGAQAWRFGPKDFAMASAYGVPKDSDLADWPITYDDLEPYYERAEWEIGVSGDPTLGQHAGRRRKPYPMPALRAGRGRDILAAGAAKLGILTHAVPLLVNSTAWLGRPACAQCGLCVGFPCPIEAKNGSHNTMLTRAFSTGRATMILETQAERLLTDDAGRVIGVAMAGFRDGIVWHKEIRAEEVVLSAGAVETARLLLNSASGREPYGIGNNHDQVGRRLQGHVYGGAVGVFDEVIEDLIGPGPSLSTTDFRHDNAGIIGGGILANEFVSVPSNTFRYLADAGLLPPHGIAAKRGMRHLTRRMTRIVGPIQEVTTADARVRVDSAVKDRLGIPVARLGGDVHLEDMRGRDFLSRKAAEWLSAAGAAQVAPIVGRRAPGPSSGQHQAGTCRMGGDPARSVTDPYGRVWGHGNLRIADGSLHVTNGGVNPVLTIYANAMRVVDHMTRGR
jgi:choline dehydrogenase-like flavoprotein